MSIHRYTSRGRTRQPKNLAMQHHKGTAVQPITYPHFAESGSVLSVPALNELSGNLNSSDNHHNGYDTENQRYLHVCFHSTGSMSSKVQICAYNRQFGKWGLLKIHNPTGSAYADRFQDVYLTGSPGDTYYTLIDIQGVDRVAFVDSNAAHKYVVLHVAGSTF